MSDGPIDRDEFAGFRFGLKKDRPDDRDYPLFRAPVNVDTLPKTKSLKKHLPDPDMMDQGPTGSCVGYSGVQTSFLSMIANKHFAPFIGSPVFGYREARLLGGYVEEDSGTELRLFWKAMALRGLPRFEEWPPNFRPEHLADRNGIFPPNSVWRMPPPQPVYDSAAKTQAIRYYRLYNSAECMKCIADGFPFQLGYAVYNSNFKNGNPVFTLKMPSKNDYIVGYHAVTAFEYSRKTNRFYLQNNWGKTAHEGRPHFSMPFEYLDKHKLDIWTVRIIEGGMLQ